MSQLPTYSPELLMTEAEKRDFRILQDPLLKMSPEQASKTVMRESGNSLQGLSLQVQRLTKIIVALNNKN